ncbi:MAG TPA: sulfite exporter TauE/SafE family protein, partial [Acidimicrobiales bacterium]
VAALATFVGATIQGSLGFGMNLVTVPALALVLPEALPVAVITLGLSISIGMLRHEHHALDRVGLAWILAGRVPGSVVGAWVVAVASTTVLEALAGAVVLAMVLASVAMPVLPVRPSTQLVAGVVSGVTGTAAGIGGPPLALLYQHRPGSTIRSTLAAAFLVGTALSLATLAVAGEVGASQVLLGLGLAPLVVVGSVTGRRFHDWLDQGWLRPGVLVFAAAAAVTVLINAAV